MLILLVYALSLDIEETRRMIMVIHICCVGLVVMIAWSIRKVGSLRLSRRCRKYACTKSIDLCSEMVLPAILNTEQRTENVREAVKIMCFVISLELCGVQICMTYLFGCTTGGRRITFFLY